MFACARDTMLVNFISKRVLEIFTTDKTTNLTSFLFYKLCAFVSSNCILKRRNLAHHAITLHTAAWA